MSKVKVTVHKGTHSPVKVSRFAGRNTIAQQFQGEFKHFDFSGQLGVLAKEQQKEIGDVARAYFVATLKGCKELITHSGVPAAIGPKYGRHRSRLSWNPPGSAARHPGVTGFSVTKTVPLQYRTGLRMLDAVMPDDATVAIKGRWKRLNYYYATRSPRSEWFFKKRPGLHTESARADFIVKIDQAIQAAEASTIYAQAITTVPKLVKEGTNRYRFSFEIRYPQLPEPYDFIRKAFVYGSGQLTVSVAGDAEGIPATSARREGIVLAESMRPFLRPYAARMGKLMRDHLVGKKHAD